MSSEKKEYHPSAPPAYVAPHQATMAGYHPYPPPAYSAAYTMAPQPTYLPASYAAAAPLQHHLPFVSVAPTMSAYGVPPAYQLTQMPQVYSARPGTVYVPAATYDASARFDGHAMPVVPPPPPGVAPNAAQLALMQQGGSPQVVLGQHKANFVTGGAGAGFTFW